MSNTSSAAINKSPLSRFLTAVSLVTAVSLALPTGFSRADTAIPQCSMKRGEDRQIDLSLNGRRISIIGWTHPVGTDSQVIRDHLHSLTDAALIGDCQKVQDHLLTALNEFHKHFDQAQSVLKRLKSVQQDFQIQTLGLEMAKEDVPIYEKNLRKKAKYFWGIEKSCPQLAEPIGRFKLIVMGPRYVFSQNTYPSLASVGVESDELRQQTWFYHDIQLDIMKRAHVSSKELTPQAIALAEKLKKLTSYGHYVDEKQIARLLTRIKTRNAREFFGDYLRVYQKITVELARKRNDAIVANVLALQGHHALVIGNAHVEDLAQKLLSACENGKSAPATYTSPRHALFQNASTNR